MNQLANTVANGEFVCLNAISSITAAAFRGKLMILYSNIHLLKRLFCKCAPPAAGLRASILHSPERIHNIFLSAQPSIHLGQAAPDEIELASTSTFG